MRSNSDDVRAAIEVALATEDFALVGRFIDELHADQLADIYARVQHGKPVSELDPDDFQAVYVRCKEMADGADATDGRGDLAVSIALALRSQPRFDVLVPQLGPVGPVGPVVHDDRKVRVGYEVFYDTLGYNAGSQRCELFGNSNVGNRVLCNLQQPGTLPMDFFVTKWSAQYRRVNDYQFRRLSQRDQEAPLIEPYGNAELNIDSRNVQSITLARLFDAPLPVMQRIPRGSPFSVGINAHDVDFSGDHARLIVYLEGFAMREVQR